MTTNTGTSHKISKQRSRPVRAAKKKAVELTPCPARHSTSLTVTKNRWSLLDDQLGVDWWQPGHDLGRGPLLYLIISQPSKRARKKAARREKAKALLEAPKHHFTYEREPLVSKKWSVRRGRPTEYITKEELRRRLARRSRERSRSASPPFATHFGSVSPGKVVPKGSWLDWWRPGLWNRPRRSSSPLNAAKNPERVNVSAPQPAGISVGHDTVQKQSAPVIDGQHQALDGALHQQEEGNSQPQHDHSIQHDLHKQASAGEQLAQTWKGKQSRRIPLAVSARRRSPGSRLRERSPPARIYLDDDDDAIPVRARERRTSRTHSQQHSSQPSRRKAETFEEALDRTMKKRALQRSSQKDAGDEKRAVGQNKLPEPAVVQELVMNFGYGTRAGHGAADEGMQSPATLESGQQSDNDQMVKHGKKEHATSHSKLVEAFLRLIGLFMVAWFMYWMWQHGVED